jgi:hypothetical protein
MTVDIFKFIRAKRNTSEELNYPWPKNNLRGYFIIFNFDQNVVGK